MTARHSIARLLLASATVVAVLGAGAPAFAASGGTGNTVTATFHQHGTWTETGDTDFCTSEEITPTITGNSVMHETYFPGGDEVWFTFTETGTATFVQPSTGLVYNGRVTVWSNYNVNNKNSNSTFTATFNFVAIGSDGVTHVEVGHEMAHIAFNAVTDQPVVEFGKMSVTCS